MKKRGLVFMGIVIIMLGIFGCADSKKGYTSISMDEAETLMSRQKNYIILDVRTEEEYESGHIPGAICIPNETISDSEISQLPEKNQMIMVYCRSGRRSKQAAEKLAKAGYTSIVEIGGIIDWTGEIEK